MKISKKAVCFVLAAAAAVCVSGCGKKTENSSGDGNSLTYWVAFNGAATLGVENFAELPPMQELMKRTGADIKFIHPTSGMETEQFNVMIAGGDYPDIIESNFAGYQGGPEQAIKDGVIISLNDLIEKSSPNFKKYMEEHPDFAKMAKSDNGTYYEYPAIYGDDYLQVYQGIILRKDILDKLGIEKPETVDEWTAMLKSFKDNGIETPLTITQNDAYAFIQAYGVTKGLYVDDGKIKYGHIEPGYKKGIQMLADWYKAGYIDKNFASADSQSIKTAMLNGSSAAAFGMTGGAIGGWLGAMENKDDTYDLTAAKYPVVNKGETPFYGQRVNPIVTSTGAAITTACKNTELAAKVLDYAYSDDGVLLFNFGIEGVSYNMVDGYPTYTELVTKDAQGRSMGDMIAYYARPNGIGASIRDKRYMEQFAARPQQKESIEIWSQTKAKEHLMPPVLLSEEENAKVNAIKSDLDSYVSSEELKFITGVRSMDEFDSYVDTIKGMGVDKYIEAYQAAYDRYIRR